MKELSFFEYIRQTGIGGAELFCLVLTAGFAALALAAARALYRGRHEPAATRKAVKERRSDWQGMLAFVGAAAATSYFGYSMAYLRYQLDYQLRPEASRYTIGEVFRYSSRKKGRVYVYRYQVRGRAYEGTTFCQPHNCPDLGTRFYITYAQADHSLSQSMGMVVPDSIPAAPAQGWTALP